GSSLARRQPGIFGRGHRYGSATPCAPRTGGAQGRPSGGRSWLQPVHLGPGAVLVLEVDLVDLDEAHLRGGHVLLGEDGIHRAGVDAGPAVDALVGVDVDHAVRISLMDAVDWADLDAGLVLEVDA